MTLRVLLLGGSAEARALAEQLVADGVAVTSSLAGRVRDPRLPVGKVRVGGFGGVAGLRSALADFDAVVDATHPFAETMSAHAAAACAGARPLLRLQRPGWAEHAQPCWHWVDSHPAAAEVAAGLGRRPFVTVGRQQLSCFTPALGEHAVLARVIEAGGLQLPQGWRLVTDRGPYDVARERELMNEHRADVLVTKDSGGRYTWPKMAAAERLGLPVVIVARPAPPPGVPVVHDVEAAVAWVHGLRR